MRVSLQVMAACSLDPGACHPSVLSPVPVPVSPGAEMGPGCSIDRAPSPGHPSPTRNTLCWNEGTLVLPSRISWGREGQRDKSLGISW